MLPVCVGSGIVGVIAIAEFDGFLQHPGFVHEESEGHLKRYEGGGANCELSCVGGRS